jgi:hypothetical protein
MTAQLMQIMERRFEEHRDDYLRLLDEERKTEREMAKVSERLRLLGKLLELEGKQVELPKEAKPRKRRRAA